MKRLWIYLAAIALVTGPAPAQVAYYEVPDVPTDLIGTTYHPWDIVRNNGGLYSSPVSLPLTTPIDALHRSGGGRWLLSVEAPTDLGGTTWDPRDVFVFDGIAVYAPFFNGAAAGIPAGVNVDAVFLEPVNAGLVISFDVPTTIGATTYQPADLVRFAGGVFSMYFQGAVAGIPPTSNVTGADQWPFNVPGAPAATLITFDVPTTTPFGTFLPGEVVRWDGMALMVWDPQPAWPAQRSSRLDGLSLPADPDVIPPTIGVTQISATQIRITWAASACAGAEDYGIYEGTLGAWYSHTLAATAVPCVDTLPLLSEDVFFSAGNHYYLVVPNNPMMEGSYGTDSGGTERPAPAAACAPQVLGCSP